MKTLIKILPIVMVVLMILTNVAPVFATGLLSGVSAETSTAQKNMTTIGNKILGIIQVVGVIVAVATLMILGIKYMMGSAEEKAEYKKTMIPYIIGAVLLVAAVALVGWIFGFGNTITGTGSEPAAS